MESPLLEYTPACAPGSGMFYRGAAFPQFKGNFFFGCLRGTRMIRVTLDGRRVVSQENLLEGKYGRIRDIAEGPDGLIYFSTSNRDGRGQAASVCHKRDIVPGRRLPGRWFRTCLRGRREGRCRQPLER